MSEQETNSETTTEEVSVEDTIYDGGTPDKVEVESNNESKDTNSSEESESDEVAPEGNEKGSNSEETKAEVEETVYEIELGKESLLDDSHVKTVVEFAKSNNLSNEQAKAILASNEKTVTEFVEHQKQAQIAERNKWDSEVRNDPEMGGDHLTETIDHAYKAIETYGSDDLKEVLRNSGGENHPAVVRFLANIGKAIASDKAIMPNHVAQTKNPEDYFYGNN